MSEQADREAADEYCDQPRCAQMNRNDKAWHRSHAAFLAGLAHARKEHEAEVRELIKELEIIATREIGKHVAHPQSVWFSEWVMEPLREIIAEHRARHE